MSANVQWPTIGRQKPYSSGTAKNCRPFVATCRREASHGFNRELPFERFVGHGEREREKKTIRVSTPGRLADRTTEETECLALGTAAEAHSLAFNPGDSGAALEADSWGGPQGVIQACYPRRVWRVSLVLMSEEAKRYPRRSRALSVSRFLEITRAIVDAQSQRRPQCARNAT
jgi:hypothetical protein